MIEEDFFYEDYGMSESSEADDEEKIDNLMKSKKKKRKFKECEFTPNVEAVIKRLNGLVIKDK